MLSQIKKHLHNRQHAGRLLADKLTAYRKYPDTIIVAIPQGGIPVGSELAKALSLPFDIVFSKRIKHPANSDQSIGAVSMEEVILDDTRFIPQTYILHQINVLQRALHNQFRKYYGQRSRTNFSGKTIILVDDVLRDVDQLKTCMHAIEKQGPAKLIVAAPVASTRTVHFLTEQNYEVQYLFLEFNQQSKAYTYFPEITEDEASNIFKFDSALLPH